MEKAFDFVRSLKPSFFEVLGYPTIKIYSTYAEVYFDVTNDVCSLDVFNSSCVSYDGFRMFVFADILKVCYTFYNCD